MAQKLIIFTDHQSLIHSFKSESLQLHSPIENNWIQVISQFTCDVRYLPAKFNQVSDFLSRPFDCPEPVEYVNVDDFIASLEVKVKNFLNPQDLEREQKVCPEVQNHRKGLHSKKARMQMVQFDTNTYLYCEVSKDTPRPLIPARFRHLLIQKHHCLDHPGPAETAKRLCDSYYWSTIKKDCKKFAKSCDPCQKAKPHKTYHPEVGIFPTPSARFQDLNIDVVGPLIESEGMKFLLTIVDRGSRWLKGIPTPDTTAESCSNAFIRGWLQRFGLPKRILTDNAQTFCSDMWRQLQQDLGIEVAFSPPFHQATNGAVERAHQTLKNSLKASLIEMGDQYGKNWMKRLPFTLLGKRISYQPDLDASSAELVLGQAVSIPGALVGDPGPSLDRSEIHKLLNTLHQKAAKPQKPMSRHQNPTTYMPAMLKDATHVYVKLDKTTPLSARYAGPFPVVSRPSKSTVTVKEGTYVSGLPKLNTYSWETCKIAHVRPGQAEGQRPRRGRPPKKSDANHQLTPPVVAQENLSNELVDSPPTTPQPYTARITQPFNTSDGNRPSDPAQEPSLHIECLLTSDSIFTGALVYIHQRLPPRVRQTSGGYGLVAIAATHHWPLVL